MSYSKALAAMGLVASVGLGSVAVADEAGSGYGGILFSRLSFSDSGYTFQPTALSGVLGYSFLPGLALEGRAGGGVGAATVNIASPTLGNVKLSVKAKSYYGAYVRPSVPLSDSFSVYALAGYADGKIEGSAMGYTVSDAASGFSWFVGGEVHFGPDLKQSFAVEWGRVLSDTDALSVMYRFRF